MNINEKTIGGLPPVTRAHQTSRLIGTAGFIACAAILGALTGCTTYVEHPRPVVYEEPRHVEPIPLPPPVATVEVVIRSEDDFYQPLSPYGRWEVVGSYGRCWIPARVEANWRPYCNGHWERTDAGWYWVSDEPWAWATYHYGSWDFSARVGWYWVPRTQWAPAWVSWHHGGGYVAWAPLPPSARFGREGHVELDARVIPTRSYVVVEERRFLQPIRPTTVVVNNTTIINKTVNITNVKVVNNTVINEGPQTEVIERASGRRVQAVPARELRHRTEAQVVAKERIPPANVERKVEAPARPEVERRELRPRETDAQVQAEQRKAQLDNERRANEAKKAEGDARRNAQESARKAQAEAERRAKETEAQVQAERRKGKGQERKAQDDAQQRAKESERQAQAEAQRNARELDRKGQLDNERRANEAKKAGADAQGNAKAAEKRGADSDPRAKGKEVQRAPERGGKRDLDANDRDGTNTVKKAQKGKGKAD